MLIFTKLSTVIKSNINDLISRAENPEKMLNQIILDMRDQLAKAKREVAAAIADERKLRASLESEVKQMRQWEHRAMLAVKEGRDDLAKQALGGQQRHRGGATATDERWKPKAGKPENLKGPLRRLNDKIEGANRRRILLVANQRRAQASGGSTKPCRGSPTRRRSTRSTAWPKRSRSRSARAWPTRR